MALINKQDAINAINAVDNYDDGLAFEVLSHACRDVALLPEVDAEPVRHGHWSFDDSDWFETVYRCTVCKKSSRIRTSYCPNCGAKMDAERK